MTQSIRTLAIVLLALVTVTRSATAQRRGGGGGGMISRGAARPSVTMPARPAARPQINPTVNRPTINANVNRPEINTNINRTNINVNRPARVDDIDIHNDWHDDDRWNGCCFHPVATAVGVAAGAALTAAAIGSVLYTLPSSCVVTVVNGLTYRRCGDTWYQPQFAGTTTTYIVINPPQ